MQGYTGGNEFYNSEDHRADPKDMTDVEVREELKVARVRLMLAASFVDLARYAYTALLHHGVNYLTLGAYLDDTILDDAKKLPLSKGSDRYITWIGRVKNDITASIARSKLKVIVKKHGPKPPHQPSKDKH